MLLMLPMHISHLNDIGCKHLTSGNIRLKRVHFKTLQYLCFFILRIEIISSLPLKYCWQHICCQADTNINSLRLLLLWINISWFDFQQHVLIRDNSLVRINYFLNKTLTVCLKAWFSKLLSQQNMHVLCALEANDNRHDNYLVIVNQVFY